MSIKSESFKKAVYRSAESRLRRGSWRVYNRYELQHDERGETYLMARPEVVPLRFKARFDERRKVSVLTPTGDTRIDDEPFFEFSPLVSHPGLFLSFARLADSGEITQEVWKGWVEGYGVLGLEQHDVTREVIERYRELGLSLDELSDELHWIDTLGREYRTYSGSAEGGPRESYAGFEREAYNAHRLLKIYEAATAKDELGNHTPDVAKVRRYAEQEGGLTGPINTAKEAKGWALAFVGHSVQEIISEDCYPLLRQEGFEITQGWGFHTLLGAMYLQMAWLMAAKEEARCKQCDQVIAFEQPPVPYENAGKRGYHKPYRTRSDKEFCDRRCKDRWYYQHVTKPKRESGGQ